MRKIGKVALTESQRNKRFYDNHREDELARNKGYYPDYYEKNKEKIKADRRNRRQGITQEWFDSKMKQQDSSCAICSQPFVKTPHIDHDHRCCPSLRSCEKCRRDLLCGDCNLGLGRFKDNIEVLTNAIQYLRRHNETIPDSRK